MTDALKEIADIIDTYTSDVTDYNPFSQNIVIS